MRVSTTLLALTLVTSPAGAQDKISGSFTARFDRDRVQINFQTDSERSGWGNYGRTLAASAFSGLARTTGTVNFTLRRAAGTFTFEGRGNSDRISGWFDFTPDEGFERELAELGFDHLEARSLFTFALEDLTIEKTRRLQGMVSDELTTRDLVKMVDHGASYVFVQEMTDLGFADLGVDEYVKARDHGVTPTYVREMRGLGIQLTLEQLITSRDHGVTSTYVQELRSIEPNLSHRQLVNARDHGVTTEFIRGMSTLGYDDLPVADYVRFKDHGVTVSYVTDLKELGYGGLTPNQLVKLRDHGVTASYVRQAKDMLKEMPSVEQLVRFRDSGVLTSRR